MKVNQTLGKGLTLFLILIALIVCGYLYQKGEITLWPKKDVSFEVQDVEVGIPFSEKEYKLSYQNNPSFEVKVLADFEATEEWIGDGEFDYSTFFEGKSSLSLSSQASQSKTILELDKEVFFEDFTSFKLFVYLRSDLENIEDFNLIFANKEANKFYKFPIRNLHSGWNLLTILKNNSSYSFQPSANDNRIKKQTPATDKQFIISKVIFELNSHPETYSSLNLDYLLGIKRERPLLDDWNTNSSEFLSLKKQDLATYLLVTGLKANVANLKAIGSAENYKVSAKFIPLNEGFFGFFLRGDYKNEYGYYLGLNGVETRSWQIHKQGIFDKRPQRIVLKKGEISNFLVEQERPYFLQVELNKTRLVLSLSTDGINFTKIGEAEDQSFTKGGVGVASFGTVFLVDDIQFSQ